MIRADDRLDVRDLLPRFALVAAAILGWKGATAVWDSGIATMYGLAHATMLAGYAAGFLGLLLACQRRLPAHATVLVPLCVALNFFGYGQIHRVAELESGNVLTTDALLFMDYAARMLRLGENPYTLDMVDAFRVNRIPLQFSTPDVAGDLSGKVAYPALSFLVFVPTQWLGIPSGWVYPIVGVITLILLYRWAPKHVRPLILLPFGMDQAYSLYTLGGVTDGVWALLLLVMLRSWSAPRRAAVWFGLACAYKHQAWVLAPFVVVRIWKDTPGDTRAKARAVLQFAGRAVAVFGVINAPFIVWDPMAWWSGVTEPVFSQLIMFGQGISSLTMTGRLVVPKSVYAVVSLGLLGTFVALYWRHFERVRPLMWLAPGIALWFSHRSLTSYWYFYAIPLVFEVLCMPRPSGAANSERPWAPVRHVAAAVAVAVAIVCLAGLGGGTVEATVLPHQRTVGQRVVELDVEVRNRGSRAIEPRFAVQSTGLQPLAWPVVAGPARLEPGATATYRIGTDVAFASFEIRRGARVTVRHAGGYEPRTVAVVPGDPSVAYPDAIPNGEFSRWDHATDLPTFWGQQGPGEIGPLGDRPGVELRLPASHGATHRRLALDTFTMVVDVPFRAWVHPPADANRGPDPAVLYGLELRVDGRRVWVVFGDTAGPLPSIDGVAAYGVIVPRQRWSNPRLDVREILTALEIPLDAGRERIPRLSHLDFAMTPMNLQLVVVARGPGPEIVAQFGSLHSETLAPDPQQAAADGAAHPEWTATWRGEGNLVNRNLDRARDNFAAALEHAPRSGRAHLGLAEVHLHEGEFAAAIGSYQQAIESGHRVAFAHKGLGWALLRSGDPHAALRSFGTALGRFRQRDHDDDAAHVADTLHGIAEALSQTGQCDRARQTLRSLGTSAESAAVEAACAH